MGDVGDLVGHHGAAAAGMLGPPQHPRLEKGAVDDQLTAAVEQAEQARPALRARAPVLFFHRPPPPTPAHGSRRRSAASASRARVRAFSFTSICSRAAAHSCGDTMGGVSIAIRFFSVDFCIVDLLFAEILVDLLRASPTQDDRGTEKESGPSRPRAVPPGPPAVLHVF